MTHYQVLIKGEKTSDDGLRLEITTDPLDWWENLQTGTCPDCGGDWVWYEGGYVPGTRKCMGKPKGFSANPIDPESRPYYALDEGCGSLFTVLGAQYDKDGGESARERSVAVLRRERFY